MTSKALTVSTARPRPRNAPWTAQSRDRFAIAESMAINAWPWDRLKLEVEATDAILGMPQDVEARFPRAIWWAVHQLFGYDDGEAFNVIFPNASRSVTQDEWRAISGVAPVTLDEIRIGRIVAFVEAARAHLVAEPPSERAIFRRDLIAAAIGMRGFMDQQARGGSARALDGLILVVDLSDGWFRIEDDESTVALDRVLKRNRRSFKTVPA